MTTNINPHIDPTEDYSLCRVCGYSHANCLGHSLDTRVIGDRFEKVTKARYRESASGYARTYAYWEKRMKDEGRLVA